MTTPISRPDRPVERATYNIEEAASRLGIGRTLARRLAREGRFPGLIKLGSRYLVSRKVVDELVERGGSVVDEEAA
jgi:excisionase family DNA binding protein